MPAYIYWGDDDFRLNQAVKELQAKVLDPTWLSFNFDKIEAHPSTDTSSKLIQGLNQLMTPPLGGGGRLVWLVNPPLTQQAEDFISELERTLPNLPAQAYLLITFQQKPDGRSKTFKFLQKYADIQEFTPKPTWQAHDLIKDIQQSAKALNLQLTNEVTEYLLEAVGNNTRQLHQALTKLDLYTNSISNGSSISLEDVQILIPNTARNSLQLSNLICQGNTSQALSTLESLLQQNEPALKIVATLSRQFRTWAWIKIMQDSGEQNDQAIAKAADIRNPKRLYFLRKEIQHLSTSKLKQCLHILRSLEFELKTGGDMSSILQTKIIELSITCTVHQHLR